MDKRLRIAGIIAAVAFSIIILTSPSEPLPLPSPTTTQKGTGSVLVLATHLDKPRHLTFGGDTIFITEQEGRIRVIENNTLLEEPLAVFRTVDAFDGGLLGIAAHPQYTENNFLYVYYTYVEDNKLWNKISKITVQNNKLYDNTIILDRIPGSKFNNGGVIKFGPDDKLYVGTGAVSDSLHLSQDMDSLAGKILRLNDDGSTPDDNPFYGSLVYSLGHRNLYGLAWSVNGSMYSSEHGPTVNDEINRIVPGGNYGWPDQQCLGSVICFDPAIEPGGIVLYSGDKLDIQNSLIMASLRATNLYKFDLSTLDREIVLGGLGRIRDVVQGPDGFLYVISSNTDGKGFPDNTDDKLLRIMK